MSCSHSYVVIAVLTLDKDTLPNAPPSSISCLVPPGASNRCVMSHVEGMVSHRLCRMVLPIKKILLSEEAVSRPIPTLSDRQFVLTKSNLTSAEEQSQRELFWYRENLLKSSVVTGER